MELPDSALIDQVEELVVLGVPPIAAVLAQGVTEQRFAEWMALAVSGGRGSRRCAEFRNRVLRAEARSESILIGRVRSAAKESWQAAAWLAERRFPERYVRRSVNSESSGAADGSTPQQDPFAEVDAVANVVPIRRRE